MTINVEPGTEFAEAVATLHRILTGPEFQEALATAARFSDQALPKALRQNGHRPEVQRRGTLSGRAVCGPVEQARLTQAVLRVRTAALLEQQVLTDLNSLLRCAQACSNRDSGCLSV